MVSNPERSILEYKKEIFLKEVCRAAVNLKVPIPKVKFWGHYENHFDKGERAHIHLSENLICIAEPELEIMSEEDIRKTATHEVSHLHHTGHGWEFQNTHQNLEIAAWQPPAGTTGALPEGYKRPVEKEKKLRPIKSRCNYHLCNKRGKTQKCKYCGMYFCEKHIKPQEPIIGTIPRYRKDEENTHPCFAYSQYLIKKEKREKEEYGEALENLLNKKPEKRIKIFEIKKVEPKNEKIATTQANLEDFTFKKEEDESDKRIQDVKTNLSTPKKTNKKKSTKLIFFIIILIILGIISFFYFQISSRNLANQIESKDMTSKTFDNLNNFREQQISQDLSYNANAYKIAIYLSTLFYKSNNYFISNEELDNLSWEHNLYHVEILTRKLDNLNQDQFNWMFNEWTSRDIFSEKILNPKFTDGALGCYKEACVLVLGIK